MMRLVIISADSTVGKDGDFRSNLDLSKCGLPMNFWAFQWNEHGDNSGHIEYNSPNLQNDFVSEIPAWATACIAVWQAKLDQEVAEAETARIAAEQAAANEPATPV